MDNGDGVLGGASGGAVLGGGDGAAVPDVRAASFAQRWLWMLDQLRPGSVDYLVPLALRLRGPLDTDALAGALTALVARHEVLRTAYAVVDGDIAQVPGAAPGLERVDLAGDPAGVDALDRETAVAALVERELRRPVDLARGPVVRTVLARLGADDHLLLVVAHHIAVDGWSWDVFGRELSAVYRELTGGAHADLPPLPLRYSDHARRQHERVAGPRTAAQLAFWRERLAGLTKPALPTDRPRPPVWDGSGDVVRFELPAELVGEVDQLARAHRATRATVLLAVFHALIARYTGQDDIAVGLPVAGRDHADVEHLIGMFVNTVVVRADTSGRPSFTTLLGRVRDSTLAALSHSEVPFELVVNELAPERTTSHNPLYQVSFSLHNAAAAPVDLPGVAADLVPTPLTGSPVDLVLDMNLRSDGSVAARLQFATALFDPATARRLADAYLALLRGALADPAAPVWLTPLLSDTDERVLRREYNDTAEPMPELCLTELFTEQVARTPDAVAVRSAEGSSSFAELDRRATALAHVLRGHDVGPETVVGVGLPRGRDLVVALLGVLKAGGAYLPLDPAHPAGRRAALLTGAGARLLVSTPDAADDLDGWSGSVVAVPDVPDGPIEPVHPGTHPDNAAYVVFTSGSTGHPKGVTVTHRNLVNYVLWAAGAYGLKSEGSPLYSPVAFDLAVTSVFPALLVGAPVTTTADDGSPGVDGLVSALSSGSFDLVKLTPTHLGLLGRALTPTALRTAAPHLVAGGEVLIGEQVAPWRRFAPDTVLFNEYGPTETTVGCATAHWRVGEVDPGALPLGVPIANTTMHVLDAEMQPTLPGAVGELYVGGVQVARGYSGRGDLTAERFVPDPFGPPGARLYRTGDLVRHDSTGALRFVSRADTQLKVHGFRIEPGEVEAALLTHPAVAEAAVDTHHRPGGAALVAYVVTGGTEAVDPADLRAHLSRTLPEHMVPTLFVALPDLPTTDSGKVDRGALPDPVGHRLVGAVDVVAPRTRTERAVADVWSAVLGLSEVDVHSSFFTVGGNSMAAIRVATRLRELLAVELPPAVVFTEDTVATLAAAVDSAQPRGHAPITPAPVGAPLPLSFAQQRLWFLHRLSPTATDYLVPLALRLRGGLDTEILGAALSGVVARHAVLRTRYLDQDGGPAQVVDPAAPVAITVTDLTDVPAEDREDRALEHVRADLAVPFDLEREHPVRATLLRLAAEHHLLLVTLHHIAFDGVSGEVFLDELAAHYAGTPLPPPTVDYADFAVWQRAEVESAGFAARLARRCAALAGLEPLELPTDRRRPRVRDTRGDHLAVEVPADLGEAVDALARARGATPFMVLLAAFQLLLSRHAGTREVTVGSPVAGRTHPETERLIGFFANTLVLRGDLSGSPSFTDLVDRARAAVVAAQADADVPFERIVAELAPDRSPARNPLFQVLFEVRPPTGDPLVLGGLTAEPVGVAWPVAKFDLTLTVRQRADGSMRCGFEYATALFDRDTVARFAEHFRLLLAAVLADPGRPAHRSDLFPAEQRALLTTGWSDTSVERPGLAIPALIAEQARRTPGAVAVVSGADSLDYARLLARATRLAHRLGGLGVVAETPVALCLRRDADLVTALLAVHLAGGVLVPVDPDHPRERRDYVLSDSGAALLLTQRRVGARPPAGVRGAFLEDLLEDTGDLPAEPLPEVDPAQAAYVVYTSGSTGRPKGVVVGHEAIRNRVLWTVREHGLGAGDRVLQKTTVAFDAAMWEFLAPLVSGGAVVVAADGVPRDPAAMVAAVREHRVTVLQLVPSVLRTLLDQPGLADCTTLRLVFCAGEALPVDLADRLLGLLPVTLTNTYGPTECAIDVTSWRCAPGSAGEIVPIGRPIDNTRVLVLDTDGDLVPIGAPGELCVAGVNLARGYAGRGDLTADRFVPNPHPVVPGERLYRTGDRVRRRADGVLEYLGRLDRQVKLRGVRIEPSEIEAVLTEHTRVAGAAVDVYPDAAGEQRLVAHLVMAGDSAVDVTEVRTHLAARLPEAMVPSVLRVLKSFPLTASGKVDRAALPGLADLGREGLAEYVAPRDDTEAAVAARFAEVLGVDRVGAHDDFFALGGHSLLVTRLVFRLRTDFDVDVPVAEVFTRRTVAALAESVRGGAPAAAGMGPVVAEPRDGTTPTALPASSAQQRLWFLDRLEPGSGEYLVPLVLLLRGQLDTAALARAADDLVARHEILRTRYPAQDGVPVQEIDPARPVGLVPVDLSGLPREDAERRARDLVGAQTSRPFALDVEWPLRFTLVRLAPDEHILVLVAHHIAVDAWSTDLLIRDLAAFHSHHAERAPAPAPLPVQYADHTAWQDRWNRGPAPAAHLAHWRERLAGLTPLELPTDRPRAAVRDTSGDLLPLEVPAGLAAAVHALARSAGVTPFVVLFSAFTVLLSRYTGQTDIAVGTPVAGRGRPEVEDVVGLFVNTVVLRADLGGDPSFTALLGRVGSEVVDAYSHQDLPFDRVVEELQPARDLSRNPLFQVMFEVQHDRAGGLRLPGLAVERVPSPWRTAKFDLTLSLGVAADGGLYGLFEYATALFDESTVRRISTHYLRLLDAATTTPSASVHDLVMLTDAERARIVAEWNPPAPRERPGTVPELFARRAAEHPDAVAAAFGADSLTYAELDERANRLAHHLRALGVGAETVVAVCLERGLDVVVSLLAVLKAGGAYVPLDPGHPGERLAFMLADAGTGVIVTVERFAADLTGAGAPLVVLDADAARIAARPAHRPGPAPAPDDLAYMIYTSGSTGKPKGVLIQHDSYAHHCAVIADAYDIGPGDRVVLLSALTFDVAMDQIAATLLVGATVVVADPLFWSPAELPDRVAEHRITIMEITPAYYREVMRHVRTGDPRLAGLRLMNVGSDVVTADDARAWAATGLPGRFLCNYGPTEATVTCLLHPVDHTGPDGRGEAALPIGRPVAGTRAYVLDGRGDPAPVGVPGELHLGGVRLARGYRERPALTAEKFVPDPFGAEPGGRLYRTGDLVRYLPDGTVEFLGRIDQQVKLRGFRIELGEVDAVLSRHPALRAVTVVARDVRPGDRRLVAYLVPHGTAPDLAALRAYAGQRLPDYMVPSVWMTLAELPLTASKKVDRKALPAPAVDRSDLDRPYRAPADPTEEIIAGLWAELLGVERVGADDDVFVLGAHSLLATRALARLGAVFGVDIPLRALFEATTTTALAEVVSAAVEAEVDRLSDDEVAELLARDAER